MQMSGVFKTFPPAELLQWAHNDRLTGTLVLRRSTREKQILLREGKIVGCLSNEPFDFYGQYLLAVGYLAEQDLLRALSACEESSNSLRLGQALVQLDILDRETVIRTLREQTEQSILDIFVWPRGVFFLLEDEPEQVPLEMPPLDPISLVFEGVRQMDEIARIRARLPHDRVVLRTGVAWPGSQLSPLARRIVGFFEPNLTLRKLHRAAGGGYCQFLTATDRLLQDHVFEIDLLGEPESDTVTLSLLDIMLDRVQSERQAMIGATVDMPIAILGQLYPVWLGDRRDAPASDTSRAVKDLARSINGETKLATLLSTDAKTRNQQLEWLWLLIGARRLALLPAAADSQLVVELARRLPD